MSNLGFCDILCNEYSLPSSECMCKQVYGIISDVDRYRPELNLNEGFVRGFLLHKSSSGSGLENK